MLLLPASIDPHRVRDALLAALALAAGSVDALTWLALGKVFSAFMTGNVVFIAVGLCSHDSGLALHAAVAVCAFGAGAFATARLMPREAPAVLWPARVTVGLLGAAFVQLAFWIVWLAVGGDPGSTIDRGAACDLGARDGHRDGNGGRSRRARRLHHGRDRHVDRAGRRRRGLVGNAESSGAGWRWCSAGR